MSVEIRGLSETLAGLEEYGRERLLTAVSACDEIGRVLEKYARDNHLWKDRTGNTQQSTKGEVEEVSREFILVSLSAGMDYDVFLELARDGKWAWLWPAVVACKPTLIQILERRLAA